MPNFYLKVIQETNIDSDDTVLIVCGGQNDRNTFVEAGLSNVLISNLDYHKGVCDYEPYGWERQDAENLGYDDGTFDWVVVCAGLHHCASPHKALCEMLRVSRKGIVVIESQDSLLMRAAVKLGLTSDFEMTPAALSNGTSGGYRGTGIPNYVYRWTEREVIKTISSFRPDIIFDFRFEYGYRFPIQRMSMSRSAVKRISVHIISYIGWILEKIIPRQGNEFAFVVTRTGKFQPWIKKEGERTSVDIDYILQIYAPEKYKQ